MEEEANVVIEPVTVKSDGNREGQNNDPQGAAGGTEEQKKKKNRRKKKTPTKDKTVDSEDVEIDRPVSRESQQQGQKEKNKAKHKQGRPVSGRGYEDQGKAPPLNIPQYANTGYHNDVGVFNSEQYGIHSSPGASMQFGGGQLSPYQDFLKRCGGDLQQLGYVVQPDFKSSPTTGGGPTYRQYNNPRGIYGGQVMMSSDNRRDQQSQKRQNQAGQQSRQQGNRDAQPGSRGGNSENRRKSQGNNTRRRQVFEPYWPDVAVSDGLKRGLLIQGALRINPKNYEDCYVPHPDGISDVYISGMKDRNRALNGDIVAVCLNPREQWKVLMDDYEGDPVVSQSLNELMGKKTTADATSQITRDMKSLAVDAQKQTVPESPAEAAGGTTGMKTPSKGSQSAKKKGPQSGKTNTPNQRFVSLGQLCTSPDSQRKDSVKKDLFGEEKEVTKSKEEELAQRMGCIPNKFLLRTGKVVCIIEKKHSRASTGHIKIMQDGNPNQAMFAPKDHRFPRIFVPMADCPKDFLERPDDHRNTLFIARLTEWTDDSMYPKGCLARSLGEAGLIEPETEGMLIENGVDFDEFPDEALACLPQNLPWSIPQSEFTYRKDLRKECIFTIDPATARDLDDSLHCTKLEDGSYEIGVHIADVSFFIEEYTALDKVAASRATSVYLVQKVIPMLPRLLCEQLCSLNPDEDRLAFSVIWKMTEDGEIYDEWFGRSIICSCAKLSYDHAQGFIEEPNRVWKPEELPRISEGFTIPMIVERVLNLQKVARNLRKKRFDSGALRLDQVKLSFALDKDSGLPCGYSVYQQRDSNRLIEEFMLLANMAVAHKIYKAFPEIAMLRRHPPPQTKQMDEVLAVCKSLGIHLDVSSSGALQQSLARYTGESVSERARIQILTVLVSKPMQNAKYFCTGCIDDEELYRHYALNVPLYTHFTSPIRRYPDVVVHRLLAAALDLAQVPSSPKGEVQKQAEHCNDKKLASKRVQELSSELFFSIFVKECGPLEEKGMVMGVLNKAFDVLVLSLGIVKRIYCEQLPLLSFDFRKDHKRPELTILWKETENHKTQVRQVLTIFTEVNCILEADPEAGPLKWKALMKHPEDDTAGS